MLPKNKNSDKSDAFETFKNLKKLNNKEIEKHPGSYKKESKVHVI